MPLENVIESPSYMVWLSTPLGRRTIPLDLALIEFEYAKRVNGVGWAKLTYGLGELDLDLLQVDSQLQIWRKPPGGSPNLEMVVLLREWELRWSNGLQTVIMKGPDQNDLLNRRIVAYFSGSERAFINSVEIDAAMKLIVDQNLLSLAVDTDRDWSGQGLSSAISAAEGYLIKKGIAWRNVLDLLQELSEASRSAEEEVFFEIAVEAVDQTSQDVNFIFRTYVGQPGTDKETLIILSPEWGTLDNVSIKYDYTKEVNFVYAGGAGEGLMRMLGTASDEDLIDNSPWGRRELFKDARNEATQDGIDDTALQVLIERRPTVTFTGQLIDTPLMRYGIHWFLGDRVSAVNFGRSFSGIIRAVKVTVDQEGKETITARLESTEVVA